MADAIAAIHVIEHFYSWEAPELLAEWRRVLKDGGKLILELPCMNKVIWYIHYAVQNGMKMSETMVWFPLWGNQNLREPAMCHKYGYSLERIQKVVQDAGFRDVRICEPRYHFKQRDMRVEAVK